MNLLAIPVFLSSFFYEEECSYSEVSSAKHKIYYFELYYLSENFMSDLI